jgi:hypothetical protein
MAVETKLVASSVVIIKAVDAVKVVLRSHRSDVCRPWPRCASCIPPRRQHFHNDYCGIHARLKTQKGTEIGLDRLIDTSSLVASQ